VSLVKLSGQLKGHIMAVYWISFRLHEDSTYDDRYKKLYAAAQKIGSKWWVDTSAFIVLDSAQSVDQVAAAVKAAIGPNDVALIGMPEFKTARLIGQTKDQDIFELMPFTKKV
jgi:hypothetical protein